MNARRVGVQIKQLFGAEDWRAMQTSVLTFAIEKKKKSDILTIDALRKLFCRRRNLFCVHCE